MKNLIINMRYFSLMKEMTCEEIGMAIKNILEYDGTGDTPTPSATFSKTDLLFGMLKCDYDEANLVNARNGQDRLRG